MADAIREITVERGHDPRDGGADGVRRRRAALRDPARATSSRSPTIVIPPFAGNFSAWGLLGADVTQTAARTMLAPLLDESTGEADEVLGQLLDELERARLAQARTARARRRPSTCATSARSTRLTVAVPVAERARSAADAAASLLGASSAVRADLRPPHGGADRDRRGARERCARRCRERVRPPGPAQADGAARRRAIARLLVRRRRVGGVRAARPGRARGRQPARRARADRRADGDDLPRRGLRAPTVDPTRRPCSIEPAGARECTERVRPDHHGGRPPRPQLRRRADEARAGPHGVLADHLRGARLRRRASTTATCGCSRRPRACRSSWARWASASRARWRPSAAQGARARRHHPLQRTPTGPARTRRTWRWSCPVFSTATSSSATPRSRRTGSTSAARTRTRPTPSTLPGGHDLPGRQALPRRRAQ